MLKFFPDRADHPLSDARVLQRVLAELAAMTPEAGLREASEWIEVLKFEPETDPTESLRILASISECVQPHARQVSESFITASLTHSPGRFALWRLVRKYVHEVNQRYGELLLLLEKAKHPTPALVSEAMVRLMRAACVAQRLDALHYVSGDTQHWSQIGRAWKLAQAYGIGKRAVRIRIGRPTETTFDTEYMRSVALASAALDELDEAQIDQAARLIHYVLPFLRLDPRISTDSLFWIDPLQGKPPVRMQKPPQEPEPSLLYFSCGKAIDTLREMDSLIHHGTIPPAVGLDRTDATLRFGPLLQHMIQHWSNEAPVRHFRRHPLPGTLRAITGLDALIEHLSGESSTQPAPWKQRDASLQGIGAEVSDLDTISLQVGTLVGLHSDDGDRWLAGVLRRMKNQDEGATLVGVELLSWHPVSARADDGAHQTRVLLLDPLQRGAAVRLAVPLGVLRPAAPLFLIAQNKTLKLTPVALVERGADHEIRSYQVGPSNKEGNSQE